MVLGVLTVKKKANELTQEKSTCMLGAGTLQASGPWEASTCKSLGIQENMFVNI